MKKLAIIIADGFEETEAIGTIDILRRAMGFSDNKIVSVDTFLLKAQGLNAIGAHNIEIKCDYNINELNDLEYSAIIFPGGPGYVNYFEDKKLSNITLSMAKDKKIIAAICAAPQYLGYLGLVDNKEVVHYPGANKYLDKAKLSSKKEAIQDENIITGRSISSAIDFALLIADNFLEKSQYKLLFESLIRQ
ncbi:DJ-1/PfpI family protein [Spiroplasma endosymbiont of Aspidapion aeneum]|uniref:DJ-1/PfpI family protein n=1 Tax=Spiroplasma endosymbiont of Aspidapion aeneum TaxID=3066276 RepID=UPI00313A9FF5